MDLETLIVELTMLDYVSLYCIVLLWHWFKTVKALVNVFFVYVEIVELECLIYD